MGKKNRPIRRWGGLPGQLLFQPAFPVVADEFVDDVTHQPDHQPLQCIRLALHTLGL